MPIKFEIYRDGRRVTQFTPISAMAIGPESVPLPAEVFFRDGHLVIHRSDEYALGVALLWDAGPAGSFHLETTRVQPARKAV